MPSPLCAVLARLPQSMPALTPLFKPPAPARPQPRLVFLRAILAATPLSSAKLTPLTITMGSLASVVRVPRQRLNSPRQP